MFTIARATRFTFLALLALAVLFTVLGARPVEQVSPYGSATSAAAVVDAEAEPATSPATVPAGLRFAGIALLAVGGAATIVIVPRRRPRPDRSRRLVVGALTLSV